jgi:hypothetical protein
MSESCEVGGATPDPRGRPAQLAARLFTAAEPGKSNFNTRDGSLLDVLGQSLISPDKQTRYLSLIRMLDCPRRSLPSAFKWFPSGIRSDASETGALISLIFGQPSANRAGVTSWQQSSDQERSLPYRTRCLLLSVPQPQ